MRHKIKINGGQKAKSRCADCGSADYERCSYLGLVVCLKRQRALRHFRFNLGREPACIEVAIVVKEGSEPTPIVTKFKRIRVTIAWGKTQARFLDIEGGLRFPGCAGTGRARRLIRTLIRCPLRSSRPSAGVADCTGSWSTTPGPGRRHVHQGRRSGACFFAVPLELPPR